MSEAVLRELANGTSRSILTLLAVEPSYPRRIAALLGLSETDVARRLRRLERLGFVEGKWGRVGKNVKLYRLAADSVTLRIAKTGLELQVGQSPARPPPAAPTLAPSIPEEEGFVGRAAEMEVLAGTEPVVVVLGMPGIGKTSLLAHYAHNAQAAGRPVFWRSLRGVESVPWLANQVGLFLAQQGDASLLVALESGTDPAQASEAAVAAMDRSGAAFILDEVHRSEDPGVRALLSDAVARLRKGRLVLGSREWVVHNPAKGGVAVVRLEGLDDAESVALLEAKGITVPQDLVPRLRAEVGGHPLGLQLLAQAAHEVGSLEALLDRIPEQDLETWLLEELYGHIGEEERMALAHASLLRTNFLPADLAAISRKRLDPVLVRLRRRMLVQETRNGYFLHEVVQNFFYSRLEDKKTLHGRAAAHYLGKGTVEGRLEAMHHFLCAGARDKVLELLEQNLDLREFDFVDAGYQRLYLSILEMFPRKEVHDDLQWGLIQDEKADIALHGGEPAKALPLYEEALAMFRGEDEQPRCADVAWKMALCLERLGRHADAATMCVQGLGAAPPSGTERERLVELADRLKVKPPEPALAKAKARK
jgi:DNA-binding Lrp family transcriptional regulator/tetratricopeptide (TPR) repeat protein